MILPLPTSLPGSEPEAISADLFGLCTSYLPTTVLTAIPVGIVRVWNNSNTWDDLASADGTYDRTQYDAVLDAIPGGTKIIYTFGKVPNYANGTSNIADPPTDNQFFLNFVTAVIGWNLDRKAQGKSYVTHWEGWNEFNLSDFWTGTVAQMAAMWVPTYALIKGLDPDAICFNPSPTNATGAQDLDAYFAIDGTTAALDQVAIHAYAIHVETLLTLIPSYKSVMVKYGLQSKQLWSTEGGYGLNANLPSDDARAGSVPRYYFFMGLMGVFSGEWYALDTTAWGTLSTGGGVTLTNAGNAYLAAQGWFAGATPISHGINGTTHEGRLTRPDGYRAYLVWDTGSGSDYTPADGVTQYRDILGNITPYSSGTVAIGLKPLLFETGDPS